MKLKTLKVQIGYFADYEQDDFPTIPIGLVIDKVNQKLSENEGSDLTISTNNPYALTYINNLLYNWNTVSKKVIDDTLPYLEVENLSTSYFDKEGVEHNVFDTETTLMNLYLFCGEEEELLSKNFHQIMNAKYND